MPPKAGAKKKAAPKLHAEDAEIDEQLLKIDIWVDSVRKEVESVFEPAVEEMRREVASMLTRLSSRVKGMRMADFLRECGGDVQALVNREKRQLKMARTQARQVAGGARVGMTVAKPFSRTARLDPFAMAAEDVSSSSSSSSSSSAAAAPAAAPVAAASSSSSSSAAASSSAPVAAAASAVAPAPLPMMTPSHAPHVRSRLPMEGPGPLHANAGASNMLPARTPAMALMKSATLLPGAHLASRTPAMNNFLPKTPGPDAANKRPRAKRRNEMVYHVAVSENGSPIMADESGSRAASAVVAPVVPAPAASSSSSVAAAAAASSSSSSSYGGAIQIGVGADAVLLEDESQVDALDGEEAARMLDALQALEARVAGLKQKVAEKAAAAVAAGGDGGK